MGRPLRFAASRIFTVKNKSSTTATTRLGPGTYNYCFALPSPPDDPASTRRPSAKMDDVALQVFEPSFDSDPSIVIWSPSLRDSWFQPERFSAFGAPYSHCHFATLPAASGTSR